MLTIISNANRLPYSQVMYVYEQSVQENGARKYPNNSRAEQLLYAEQDLFAYLQNVLERKLAVLAFWSHNNRFVSGLRLEKYRDGWLLTSLETAPMERERGFASLLVRSVLKQFADCRIYSHISDNNYASIAIHLSCGFQKIEDRAVFLDGSQSSSASTYLYENE